MQTESVRKRIESKGNYGNTFESLSFRIYSLKSDAGSAQDTKYDAKMLIEVENLPYYLASREVTKRFSLKPGKYVIIPSMFEKNVNMKFLLRVFYESLNDDTKNAIAPLKPMSPMPNKTNDKIDSTKPVILPINKNNEPKNEQPIVDMNDRYNKWFFDGLSSTQISNFVKEAQLASSKLKRF
jgi:hypothetical protein